jgi:hypothetical protein
MSPETAGQTAALISLKCLHIQENPVNNPEMY